MDTRVYRAFEQQVEMGKKGLKVLEDWENMTAEQKAELYPPRFRLCGYGR